MSGLFAPPPKARTERRPATPYVGLVPYQPEDAPFFFGRSEEKQIVTANLRAARLTILYGPSGVGKTSLLQAGVVHDLREQMQANTPVPGQRAPFAVCDFSAWRDDPLAALVEALHAAAGEALGGEHLHPWVPGEPLVEAIRAWTARVRTLLVVLDQFEDYFLYQPDEEGEGTFAHEFARIVNEPNLRVHFLLSLREDAWAKLDRFEGEIPRLFGNYVRVEHLDAAAAREAIKGPINEWNRRFARERPYTIEPAVVDAVIGAASAGQLTFAEAGDGDAPATVRADAVEAPFLQLVLDRLWRATVEEGARELTLAQLEQLGGAQSIVDSHLNEALGGLTEAEQGIAVDVFRFLVTRSKTRIAQAAADLAEWTNRPEPQVMAVLDTLCSGEGGRILRPISPRAGESEDTRYELFHDVLAAPVLDWRARNERAQTERRLEREKREAEMEARKERRRATVFRALAAGSVILAVVAIASTLAALQSRRETQRQAALARTQAQLATSRSLAVQSVSYSKNRLPRSLLLAVEAVTAAPTLEAREALLDGLQRAPTRLVAFLLDANSQDDLGVRESSVTDLAFAPDGSTIAVGTNNGVILWNAKTRKRLGKRLPAGRECGYSSSSVAFSPDSKTIAVGDECRGVVLWDVRARQRVGRLLRIRTETSKITLTPRLAFSPHGNMVAAGGVDAVLLWDPQSHDVVGRVPARIVNTVAFSPDGRTLAVGDQDGVLIWDVEARGQLGRIRGRGVRTVAFVRNGDTLAVGDTTGVTLWDVHTRKRVARIPRSFGHFTPSPDGNTLAVVDGRGVRLWHLDPPLTKGDHLDLGIGARQQLEGLAFSADGKRLLVASDAGVSLWNVRATPRLGHVLASGSAKRVAISQNGTLAVGGTDDVSLWDVETQERLGDLRGRDIETLTFAPDGVTLAVGAKRGVSLWNVKTRERVGGLRGRNVQSVAFAPDGRTVAVGDKDDVSLWNVEAEERVGKPIMQLSNYRPEPATSAYLASTVAFSPDGKTLALGAQINFENNEGGGYSGDDILGISLWDARSRRLIAKLPQDEAPGAYAVVFSPDGKLLAVADLYGKISLWNVSTNKWRDNAMVNSRAGDPFVSLAFSPDGTTIASGTFGAFALWDVASQEQIGGRFEAGEVVWSLSFVPDGDALVSADAVHAILWEIDLVSWRRRACVLANRNLTAAEWTRFIGGPPRRTCS